MENRDMVEIRWHGRGGQGAKMACFLLAEVAGQVGKFVQGFPEYGPERMGAPMTAYNRISQARCPIHSNIHTPHYVVVLDETLLDSVDVTDGLREGGAIILNTSASPQKIRAKLPGFSGAIYTLDGRRLSQEILGRNFPNTALLAAVVKVSGVLDLDSFFTHIEASFHHKFSTKPQVIAGNMQILRKATQEVTLG